MVARRRREASHKISQTVGRLGPSIATQLNSTSSCVKMRRRSVYSDPPTQLNSTRQREQLSPISSERRDPVRLSIATQLNSTSSGVELSCVAINGSLVQLVLWMRLRAAGPNIPPPSVDSVSPYLVAGLMKAALEVLRDARPVGNE